RPRPTSENLLPMPLQELRLWLVFLAGWRTNRQRLDVGKRDGGVVASRPTTQRQQDQQRLVRQPLAAPRAGLELAESLDNVGGGHGWQLFRSSVLAPGLPRLSRTEYAGSP